MRFRWLKVVPLLLLAAGPSRADERGDLLALIDRAVQASGGEAEVAKLHALTWTTRAFLPDAPQRVVYTDESSAQGLDQYRADLNVEEKGKFNRATMVANKKRAWFKAGSKVVDAGGDFLAVRQEVFYAIRLPELLLPLKAKDSGLAALGEVNVAGRAAVGVRVSRQGHADLNVYFDKATGLLARTEMRMKLPDGREVVGEYLVSDYKDFGALKHFTRATLKVEGEELFTVELSDLRPLGRLDDAVFAKP